MNKLSLFILLIVISSFIVIRQDSTKSKELARVEKIEGKEIYLFSEPLTPYKVVGDYNNSKNLISTCNLRSLVDSYLKRAKKEKIKFDALFMDTQDNIYLIKFIKEPQE